tara:strand:+ start:2540 stop:3046 length:507 start_codon:yes stop_codon:yes gene_type:complete
MGDFFNNLGIDLKLLAAQAINFLLVLWLLNRFVFKRILGFLEKRKEGIAKGLELTTKAKREMERIREARKRALQEVKLQANTVLTETRKQASEKERETIAAAKESAQNLLLKTKQEAARQKQDTVKEAEEEIQKRSVLLAERVLERTLSAQDEKRMEKEVVEFLQRHD